MRWLLLVTLVACSKKQPPPANEFEAFERAYVEDMEFVSKRLRDQGQDIDDKDIPTSYRAVYIGPPGVFIDRQRVATLSELTSKRTELLAAIDANAKLSTLGYTGLSVTFDFDAEPAATAIDALRLFAGRETYFSRRAHDPEIPIKSTQILCGQITLRDKPIKNPRFQEPQLSIFLDKDHMWLGVSQINEFNGIPDLADKNRDFDKLSTTLRVQKKELVERTEIELAASAGTAGEVLAAFDIACIAGFSDIAILTPDQLSARPQL